jgi:spermidine/putrescine transport system substrate-binding protein
LSHTGAGRRGIPGQAYSVPWQWGTTSFGLRRDFYPSAGISLQEFAEPSAGLKNRLLISDAPDEIVNLAHLYLGTDFCSGDEKVMARIADLFRTQKRSVRLYASEGIDDLLAAGDVFMASLWSGDALAARLGEIPELVYAYPKEGVLGWFDSLAVPTGARNVAAARTFMNFVMAPENIAIQSRFTKYRPAIRGPDALLGDHITGTPEFNTPGKVQIRFAPVCPAPAQRLIDAPWRDLFR